MDRHKQMIKTSISVGIYQVCYQTVSKSSTLAGNKFWKEWKLRAAKLKTQILQIIRFRIFKNETRLLVYHKKEFRVTEVEG